jgi:uncharacterized protein (DUF58 family)
MNNLLFAADLVSNNLLAFSFAIAITATGLTVYLIKNIHHTDDVERQIDTTRVQEGLPTDVTITPEDFRAHPELAEIFDITDTENNLDVTLESQEHLEMLEAQSTAISYNNIMAVLEAIEEFIFYFF